MYQKKSENAARGRKMPFMDGRYLKCHNIAPKPRIIFRDIFRVYKFYLKEHISLVCCLPAMRNNRLASSIAG
ncbi:MAG: hypothetical protein DRG35_06895 [Deltaproteobacteria bacterium]|nr:MAG: hypothetical protein DRG35_06895 [Deltaproteobacteria bacterium]